VLFRSKDSDRYNALKDKMMAALKTTFRPEFINRIDDIIVFRPLAEKDIEHIAEMMMNDVTARLKEQYIDLEADAGVYAFLAKTGFDDEYGARPLRRAILHHVENPLAEAVLRQEYEAGDTVLLAMDEKGENIIFRKAEAPVKTTGE
jgi:ATP-dependent Clp protease ATP-binding subunit ClpC